MTDPAPRPTETAPKQSTRRELVTRLRGALEHADPGTLAALRRAKPDAPPAAFYRLALPLFDELLPDDGPLRDTLEARWAVIASAMARAQGFLAPVPLGEALALAGVAELRVLRLLEAEPEQLPELVRQVVHQLVQKGQPFDPHDLADLVLARAGEREPRRKIARHFYRNADT